MQWNKIEGPLDYPPRDTLVITCRDTGNSRIYEAEYWSKETEKYQVMNNIIAWAKCDEYLC